MKKLFMTLGVAFTTIGVSFTMATNIGDTPEQLVSLSSIIKNKVCIESPQTETKCDSVTSTIVDSTYACSLISSSGNVVELNNNGNGSMTFRCEASTNGTHTFKISCGDENRVEKRGNLYVTHTCSYNSGAAGYYRTVSCLVDDDTSVNPSCKKTISIDYMVPNCGNGIIEPGEDCDYSTLPRGESQRIGAWLNDVDTRIPAGDYEGYSCKKCKIISGGNYVYEPAECLYTDTPISVMNNEILPFWWRLWIKDTQRVKAGGNDISCSKYIRDDDITILNQDTMICKFAVYNGTHRQGEDDPIRYVEIPCFNENFETKNIYKYFEEYHKTNSDGANIAIVNFMIDGNNEYGEYKIALEEVRYQYCNANNGRRERGYRYGPVCEVDFAVTRPYVMQISTLGASPVGTDSTQFLDDYYDMQGERLLKKTDLADVIKTNNSSYTVESNAKNKFKEFSDKYEKLAIKVDNNFKVDGSTRISDLFNDATEIKKVPNQSIYFIEGNGGTLTLESKKIGNKLTSAYTIIVKGMDVEIKGDVLQYAMIVTDGEMSFVDGWPDTTSKKKSRCSEGGQVVQGIYVALSGFKAIDSEEWLRNTKADELRCPRGGLHVKGVLIGAGIENIMNAKRSQLNSWFNTTSSNENTILRERRQKIIAGAAVLIEYSPSLWKTLPPGAEIFTESLEVYRK